MIAIILSGTQKKRERTGNIESTVGKRKCCISLSINGPTGIASGLDFTGVKSSMPLVRHDGSWHHHTSFAEVSSSTTETGTASHKAESEGEKSLNTNYVTARLGKRSRPFSWQRRQKQRQSSSDENSLNIQYSTFPTNIDCVPGSFHCSETSLGHHEKVIYCFLEILLKATCKFLSRIFWKVLELFHCIKPKFLALCMHNPKNASCINDC